MPLLRRLELLPESQPDKAPGPPQSRGVPGSVQLPATSNPTTVLVTSSPLVSIAVAPSTLPATVPEGVGIQFAATGTFANGSTENLTSNVNWASTQPLIATVSDTVGQQGIATGVSPGQSSITAVFAGVVGSATLTVTNATIMSIAVSSQPSYCKRREPVSVRRYRNVQ